MKSHRRTGCRCGILEEDCGVEDAEVGEGDARDVRETGRAWRSAVRDGTRVADVVEVEGAWRGADEAESVAAGCWCATEAT